MAQLLLNHYLTVVVKDINKELDDVSMAAFARIAANMMGESPSLPPDSKLLLKRYDISNLSVSTFGTIVLEKTFTAS